MFDSLYNPIPQENFSKEKILSLIRSNVSLLFTHDFLSHPVMKMYIHRECERPLANFMALVDFYLSNPEKEGYEELVKAFLTKYEVFMETYKATLLKNGFNRPVCAGIAIIWLRIIEHMDWEAKMNGDMLLRSIAMQLDVDMMRTIESLFGPQEPQP